MLISSLFTALYIILCVFIFNYMVNEKNIKIKYNLLIPIFILGLFVKAYAGYITRGHNTDMSCFIGWAKLLNENGIENFYSLPDFTDYPPGYMYVLKILGDIIDKFNISGNLLWLVIKLPAILCDIIMGVIIYKIAKTNFDDKVSAIISGLYLLNPVTIINSSLWGQVDSIYLLFLVVSLCFLIKQRILVSYLLFSIAIILKPQALIFTPVYIFSAYEYLVYDKKQLKNKIFKITCSFVCAALMLFIMILPFGNEEVLEQYIKTLSSYEYMSVNAFNIWGMINKNWEELSLLSSIIGYAFIPIICIVAGLIYFKIKDNSKYFLTSAFLCFSTYMLCVKMHDRYAFCAIAMMLIGFLLKPNRKSFFMYLFLTISQVINTSWILYVYEKDPNLYFKSGFIIIASFVNVVFLICMIFYCFSKKDANIFTPSKINKIEKSGNKFKITAIDVLIMSLITISYSGIALYNLGSTNAPQKGYELKSEETIKIELEDKSRIDTFCVFNRNIPVEDENFITIRFYNEFSEEIKVIDLWDLEVFAWHFENVGAENVKYIGIENGRKDITINEIAFYDGDYQYINMSKNTPRELRDEKETVPLRESYYNSTYFDEIYHARTAYEFINGDDVYEWTHPPLGKIFIAMGVRMFGMNPFGWRIIGTVFGIVMLIFIYVFIKKMTNLTWLSGIVMIIFAFDFMHFTQTRIATIDVYVTFFIILMYLFMYIYYRKSFYDTKLWKTFIPLFASGVCFGLGVSCKWTGVYAGTGLCVIFFMTIHKRYKEYLFAKENKESAECKNVILLFRRNTIKTLAFCVFAFIIIPVIIYLVSYIPYVMCEGGGIGAVIKNQSDMFLYHSETVLNSTHPFSSKWYEWIIMKRPIWYYSYNLGNGFKEGISAFGNPLVWWIGIGAVIYMLYIALAKKDKNAIFIITGYLSQLVPWFFVDRVVFIYHYFPSTIFLVLAIGYTIYLLYNRNKNTKYVAYVYALAVMVMFIAFYPVISGMSVDADYVYKYLKWFEEWILI